MAIDRRHFIGATAATGAFTAPPKLSPRPHPQRRAPCRFRASASKPSISACASTAPKTRPRRCSARSTAPRARGCRSSSRPASIAHAAWCCRPARGSSACPARRASSRPTTRRSSLRAAPTTSCSPASSSTAAARRCPRSSGLIQLANGRGIAIRDCEVIGAGRNGIVLEGDRGRDHRHDDHRRARRRDPRARLARPHDRAQHHPQRRQQRHPGVALAGRRRRHAGARQPHRGHRGAAPAAPARTATPSTCSAPHNVTVRGNRIRNAAFSAVRGNAASNIQITNNTCTGLGEVAIYAEFGFEGAVIANNTIDGAAIGVAVTNFNRGRPARGRAGQPDPQSRAEAARPAPIRTTAPASASASRPTPR